MTSPQPPEDSSAALTPAPQESSQPSPDPTSPLDQLTQRANQAASKGKRWLKGQLRRIPLDRLPLDRFPLDRLPPAGANLPKLPDWDVGAVAAPIGENLRRFVPVDWVGQKLGSWFRVSDRDMAEILARIRSELPTTEVLLIGKPQVGKSSIVRGLTGVSEEIIGQGFRPHTQHTQRYNYPTDELPLLIFTDTVGLGDGNQSVSRLVAELIQELDASPTAVSKSPSPESPSPESLSLDASSPESPGRSRLVIWTVKASDFALDSLCQIAQQLRDRYPQLPCLLAITCLHELYPPDQDQHPPYPPELPQVQRAVAALQQTFAGLGDRTVLDRTVLDRTVLLDFTLESDGYDEVFYGREALVESLAALLPQAQARAMHQLLVSSGSEDLSNLYREAGRRYILPFAIMAGTAAAVPLPFATMPVLTVLQGTMVGLLGKLYGQTLSPSQAGGVVSAIAGGFLAQAVGRELVKFLPGVGSVIAASWAAAYTWALGEAACVYFGDVMGGKTPDPQRIQAAMRESFEAAKDRFR
jgi:uncharacterized protein (DUF697 family)